jgi:hypothetical protein
VLKHPKTREPKRRGAGAAAAHWLLAAPDAEAQRAIREFRVRYNTHKEPVVVELADSVGELAIAVRYRVVIVRQRCWCHPDDVGKLADEIQVRRNAAYMASIQRYADGAFAALAGPWTITFTGQIAFASGATVYPVRPTSSLTKTRGGR